VSENSGQEKRRCLCVAGWEIQARRNAEMKKTLFLLPILFLVLAMTACVVKPSTKEDEKETEEAVKVEEGALEEWVIVDHRTKDLGGNVPRWVTKTPLELQKEDMYKDYYVFIEDQMGKDLDGIKIWATNFSVNANIARMVANRVENRFAGAAVGDKDMVETYMENVVKAVSAASFARVVIEDEFWIKRQNKTNGEIEYRYLFLVTVPRSEIDAAINRSFQEASEQSKPKTEEEKVARERVQEIYDEGF
jgi:hypothetical protein